MSISAINGTSALQYAPPTERPRQEPSLDNTAKLLGVSTDDLRTDLQSGKTLDDLASAKGVSSGDLLSAVKSDLQANKPAGAPDLSDDQLTQMATGVAAGKGAGGAHGHHGHHHHGGGAQAVGGDDASGARLQSLASTLGVNSDDLLGALQSGANLSDLLGSAAQSPYGTGAANVDGGLVVDEYA
jgi:hypothetical protein